MKLNGFPDNLFAKKNINFLKSGVYGKFRKGSKTSLARYCDSTEIKPFRTKTGKNMALQLLTAGAGMLFIVTSASILCK